MKLAVLVTLSLGLVTLACGGSDGGNATDTTPVDATDAVPDADATPNASDAKGDLPADPGDDVDWIDNEWGFPMRQPQKYAFEYEPPWGDTEVIEALDADWLCTFAHAGVSGVVYLQNTPVRVESMGLSTNPVFEGRGGWLWVDGALTDLLYVAYDWGSNHHNEYLEFDYAGKRYKAWHSSIGAGFRACHTPDCLQVYEVGALVEDGCTADRTLPITCSPVKEDGTWEPLVDTFEPCR